MKKSVIVILIFFICSISYSQSGWINYLSGTNKQIRGIYFINQNTGWFVADTSAVFKTTNGGLNWIPKPVVYVIPIGLRAIYFLDNNTGYAVGGHEASGPYGGFYYQYVFRTTNGGDNWNLQYNVQGGGNCDLNDIYCSPNNIFVTGAGISGGIGWGLTGGIFKSTNGGSNFSFSFGRGESTSLSFINSNTGWVNSYYASDDGSTKSFLMKTINAGVNWIEQIRDSVPFSSAMKIVKLQFVNESTGFALGLKSGNKFLKTTNGGTNWAVNVFPNFENSTLFFADANTGWIGGGSTPDTSCISYTSNGGDTWMKQKRGYTCTVNCFYFINGSTGWAGLSNGQIMKTVNGGITSASQISSEVPLSYSLSQNYPNPFNNTSNLKFEIARHGGSSTGHVKLVVYDVQGREVKTLVNERLQSGTYEVTFDGSALSSGVYFYKMTAGNFKETKKLLLLK